MLATRLTGSCHLCFSLRSRNDKLGHPDSLLLGPGNFLGIREAAALLPTLLSRSTSAGAILAGKRRRIFFLGSARLCLKMKRTEHHHHREQQQKRCAAPGYTHSVKMWKEGHNSQAPLRRFALAGCSFSTSKIVTRGDTVFKSPVTHFSGSG
jgi:hypothetical protein